MDRWDVFQEDTDSRHLGKLGAQLLNNLVRRKFTLPPRFESHEKTPGIGTSSTAYGGHETLYVGILGDDRRHRFLMKLHAGKGGSMGSFNIGVDPAGILRREKSHRNDPEQPDRQQ